MFSGPLQEGVSFDEAWREEEILLCKQRAKLGLNRKEGKTAGIALSGGGVRAAAFSLGVMQALNKRKEGSSKPSLLDEFDYLSTVSGGGYAGAAVTWFRQLAKEPPIPKDTKYQGGLNENPTDAPQKKTFSFSKYRKALKDFPRPYRGGSGNAADDALNFIRYRKNHLTPTVLLNPLSLFAIIFRTTTLSFPIYLAPITVFFLICNAFAPYTLNHLLENGWLRTHFYGFASSLSGNGLEFLSGKISSFPLREDISVLFLVGACFLILFILWNFIFLTASRLARRWRFHYRFRRLSQAGIGLLLLAILGVAAMLAAKFISAWMFAQGDSPINSIRLAVTFLLGNSAAVLSFRTLLGGGKINSQIRAKITIIAVAILLLMINLIVADALAQFVLERIQNHKHDGGSIWTAAFEDHIILFIFLVIIVSIIAGSYANLNYVSLNRMYRDRLMETFMPDFRTIHAGVVNNIAQKADSSFLCEMEQRPYHLINTHVVLSSSVQARERGRTGDSFLLSPRFCGSRATRYARTKDYGILGARKGRGGITLATAMAISGAAFNPRVGPSGWDTPINNPIIFAMLSYYNLRLGCWVANPGRDNKKKEAWPSFYREGWKGIFNVSFKESANMVELTDGGHFENTGLYELLQRRTDVIVLCDATADGVFNFKDIGVAIERARADLGVKIRFSDLPQKKGEKENKNEVEHENSDYDLTGIMPGSVDIEHYDKRYNLAKRGFAIADFTYPKSRRITAEGGEEVLHKKHGRLYYIKAVMTRNLPGDLYGYSGAFKEFPYQPITDQMFDESQFDAYRELGYRHAHELSKEFGDDIRHRLQRGKKST